jgi:hypothetical protein
VSGCANCGAALDGPFCAQCGQKAGPLNPSFHDVLHDVFHEVAHLDSKLAQSMKFLLTRPGFLTQEYFAGRRVRYVSPIRLYLTMSLLYFAVAAVAPTELVRITKTSDQGEPRQQLEQRREELQHAANEAVIHWAPRAMFLLVPLFAALIAVAARRSGRNYPQHLYFALHVHAAWFFAGAVAAAARLAPWPPFTRAVSGVASVYAVVYFVLAFRRAYEASRVRAVVRTAAVAGTYAVAVILTLIAIVFPAIMGRG